MTMVVACFSVFVASLGIRSPGIRKTIQRNEQNEKIEKTIFTMAKTFQSYGPDSPPDVDRNFCPLPTRFLAGMVTSLP